MFPVTISTDMTMSAIIRSSTTNNIQVLYGVVWFPQKANKRASLIDGRKRRADGVDKFKKVQVLFW